MWRQLSARGLLKPSGPRHFGNRQPCAKQLISAASWSSRPLPARPQPLLQSTSRGESRQWPPSSLTSLTKTSKKLWDNHQLGKKRLNLTTQSQRGRKWESRRGNPITIQAKKTKLEEDNILGLASLPRLQLMAVKPNPWKQRPLPSLDSQHSQQSRAFR